MAQSSQQSPQVQPKLTPLVIMFIIIASKFLNTFDKVSHNQVMSFSFSSCMLKKQLECRSDTPDHDKLSAPRWRNHIYFPTGVKLIAFVNQDSRQSI